MFVSLLFVLSMLALPAELNVVVVGGEALNPTRRCKDAGDDSFSTTDLVVGIGVLISEPVAVR